MMLRLLRVPQLKQGDLLNLAPMADAEKVVGVVRTRNPVVVSLTTNQLAHIGRRDAVIVGMVVPFTTTPNMKRKTDTMLLQLQPLVRVLQAPELNTTLKIGKEAISLA